MAKRITIQFIGASDDAQDVRLSDFIGQLEAIKAALKESERYQLGSTAQPLDYRVVDLSHSSPATVVLEPILGTHTAIYADRVLKGFATELRSIKKRKRVLGSPDMQRMNAYREMGGGPKRHIAEVKIGVDRKDVLIDNDFQVKLKDIIGPDEIETGSVTGMLEWVNLHNTNKFKLYPNVGPARITGSFNSSQRPRIREAVDRLVTIYGHLHYKAWDKFPYHVDVKDIDIHEDEAELPSLSDLKGMAPGLTGNLSSLEFIEKVRDENW